jgi:glycosyltransferase involved in cell wall biosynthesis
MTRCCAHPPSRLVTNQALHPSESPLSADTPIEITIVMPCLDEAETLAICIEKAQRFLRENNLSGEVLIADNGSTDGSQKIATDLGARVVPVAARGYGAALIGGIAAAKGKYVAMGDADDSYDFLSLMPFLVKLRAGADLVMGNRFTGGIGPGAMPPLHRYLGNPVLSFLGRLFYKIKIGDFHCGLRAFSREAILGLNLNTPGMEFASEMVVKASLQGLRIEDVPTKLVKDGRSRPPHLRSWRDGWRHLKFLLTFAPNWLFMVPGLMLMFAGLFGLGLLLPGDAQLGQITLGVHSLLYSAAFVLMGAQIVSFAYLAGLFGIREGFWPQSSRMKAISSWFTIETGSLLGLLLLVCGGITAFLAVSTWAGANYGAMKVESLMRLAIPSFLMASLGLQCVFTSFFAGLLGQPRHSK